MLGPRARDRRPQHTDCSGRPGCQTPLPSCPCDSHWVCCPPPRVSEGCLPRSLGGFGQISSLSRHMGLKTLPGQLRGTWERPSLPTLPSLPGRVCGSPGRLPVNTQGLCGSPGFLICGMGTASLPSSGSGRGQEEGPWLVRVVGESREPRLLFRQIQSSEQGWELPRRAWPLSVVRPGAQEERR